MQVSAYEFDEKIVSRLIFTTFWTQVSSVSNIYFIT